MNDRQDESWNKKRPDTPVIDETFLAQYAELDVAGEPSVLSELIRRFLQALPENLNRMRSALAGDTPAVLRREAHAFKNVAGNVGARGLMQICGNLERIGEGGDVTSIDRRRELQRLLELLAEESARVSAELERKQ